MNSWDVDLVLIGNETTEDEFGNQISNGKRTEVQASEFQVSRYEFYQAAKAGIRASRGFVIHTFEYDNEQMVEVDGVSYSVIRTFKLNADELEIYVEDKVGDK